MAKSPPAERVWSVEKEGGAPSWAARAALGRQECGEAPGLASGGFFACEKHYFLARALAPFRAEVRRFAAVALRVPAAFLAALERLREPPPARSLIESATAESSFAS